MLLSHSDDPEFNEEFNSYANERQLVKMLAVLRSRANLSQKELALSAKCGQAKISKLERGKDYDIKFGEVLSYLQATGHIARIFFIPANGTLTDEVKMHACAIKHLLDRMVALAGEDAAITKGVAEFIEEAAFNLTRMTKLASSALPKPKKIVNRIVEVEAPQLEKIERGQLVSSSLDHRQGDDPISRMQERALATTC